MTDAQINPYSSPREIKDYNIVPSSNEPSVIVPVPTVAKVIGIANLIWGFLGIFTTLYKALIVLGFAYMGTKLLTDPTFAPTFHEQTRPLAGEIALGSSLLCFLWCLFDVVMLVMLFASGTGLLRGRVRGRIWALREAYCSLASQTIFPLVFVAAMVVFLFTNVTGLDRRPEEAWATFVSNVMPLACMSAGLIHPVMILIVLTRQRIHDALRACEMSRGIA